MAPAAPRERSDEPRSRSAPAHRLQRAHSSRCRSSSLTPVLNEYFRWTWHNEAVTEHCPSPRVKIGPRGNGTSRSHRLEARNRSPMPCHLNDLPALDARDHAFEVLLELTDRNISSLPHV